MVLWVAFKLLLLWVGGCRAYRFADHVVASQEDDQNEYNQETGAATAAATAVGEGVTFIADLPPPTSTLPCFQTSWHRTDELLSFFWEDNVGYSLSSQEDDKNHHPNRELTYGEVTVLGGRQLAYEMGIGTGTTTVAGPNDAAAKRKKDVVIFYDLGSGVGRLVAQMYLDQPWRVQKSVGIELSLERHQWAIHALTGLEQHQHQQDQRWLDSIDESCSSSSSSCDSPADLLRTTNNNNNDDSHHHHHLSLVVGQSIEFHHGNVLEVNVWRDDATHIFVSSLCFPEAVLDALQQQIILDWDDVGHQHENNDHDSTRRDHQHGEDRRERRHHRQRGVQPNKNLQVVASLNRLGRLYKSEEWEERTVSIQMSWGPGTVKIYHRRKKFTP